MKGDYFQIAIDGPVGAGKSTVAKLVAEKLGWLYVYTGAMYRAAALLAKRSGISWSDGKRVSRLVEESEIEMRNPEGREKDGRVTTLLLNGQDVSREIMTEEISEGSSRVAVHKEVREVLVDLQQKIARLCDAVVEGRDTTFRVLPDAELKIYLTAGEEVRARRRYKQLLNKGKRVDFEKVLSELKERDKRDSGRAVDPLQVVEDAWVLDTTELSIEQVVQKIVERVSEIRR